MPRVYALSADPYRIVNEQTGEVIEGLSLWYCNKYRENSAESRGHKPIKVSVSESLLKAVMQAELPGVVELDFETRPGKDNKASLVVTGFTMLAPVPLEKIFAAVPQQAQR